MFSRLEGRASALCVVGVQENRYADWGDMIQELETAFGELDPNYTWDKRLLNLRQGGRAVTDHVSEFGTIANRAGFGAEGRGLTSILRNSLSSNLKAKIATEDVHALGFTAFVGLCMRHDHARRGRPWDRRLNQLARGAPGATGATPPPARRRHPTRRAAGGNGKKRQH